MNSKLLVFLVFVLFALPTCVSGHPHIAKADYTGPYISIEDVNYIPGRHNAMEDQTEVTIYGDGWNTCDRIWVYVNGMRNAVFDPKGTSWTITVSFAAIRDECSIQVEGSSSGWSNICYFDGATAGPNYLLLQSTVSRGVVGTEVGIAATNWYPPRGLITISFGNIVVARVYPAETWTSTFTVPEFPEGTYPVTVRDESTSKTFDFDIVPSIQIEPKEVSPGQLMTIIGHGFAANHYANLSPVGKLVYTSSIGSFRLEGVATPAGPFRLEVLDEDENLAWLDINPQGNTGSSTNTGSYDATIPGYPTTVTIPPPTIPSSTITLVLLGVGALVIIVLVVVVVLMARARARVG